MFFAKAIYRVIECIAEPGYIVSEEVLLDSYCYSLSHAASHFGPFYSMFIPREAATILPRASEEVRNDALK